MEPIDFDSQIEDGTNLLQCKNCKKSKPIDDFRRDKKRVTKHASWCKDCESTLKAGWDKPGWTGGSREIKMAPTIGKTLQLLKELEVPIGVPQTVSIRALAHAQGATPLQIIKNLQALHSLGFILNDPTAIKDPENPEKLGTDKRLLSAVGWSPTIDDILGPEIRSVSAEYLTRLYKLGHALGSYAEGWSTLYNDVWEENNVTAAEAAKTGDKPSKTVKPEQLLGYESQIKAYVREWEGRMATLIQNASAVIDNPALAPRSQGIINELNAQLSILYKDNSKAMMVLNTKLGVDAPGYIEYVQQLVDLANNYDFKTVVGKAEEGSYTDRDIAKAKERIKIPGTKIDPLKTTDRLRTTMMKAADLSLRMKYREHIAQPKEYDWSQVGIAAATGVAGDIKPPPAPDDVGLSIEQVKAALEEAGVDSEPDISAGFAYAKKLMDQADKTWEEVWSEQFNEEKKEYTNAVNKASSSGRPDVDTPTIKRYANRANVLEKIRQDVQNYCKCGHAPQDHINTSAEGEHACSACACPQYKEPNISFVRTFHKDIYSRFIEDRWRIAPGLAGSIHDSALGYTYLDPGYYKFEILMEFIKNSMLSGAGLGIPWYMKGGQGRPQNLDKASTPPARGSVPIRNRPTPGAPGTKDPAAIKAPRPGSGSEIGADPMQGDFDINLNPGPKKSVSPAQDALRRSRGILGKNKPTPPQQESLMRVVVNNNTVFNGSVGTIQEVISEDKVIIKLDEGKNITLSMMDIELIG